MSTVGVIDVLLRADTKKFSKGTKHAQTAMGKLGESFKRIQGIAAGFLEGAVIFSALSRLKEGVEEAFDSLEQLSQTSQALGISTRALSSLGYAAAAMGVKGVNMGDTLTRMEAHLGSLSVTASATKTALESYGVNIQKIASESPDKAFADTAEAVSKAGSSMQKATIAMALLGRQGLALLPLLNKGKAGLAEAAAEARKMGLSIGAIQAAKAEAAAEAVRKIGLAFKGLSEQIAINLAPYITVIANKITKFATAGGNMGTVVFNAFKYVILGASKFADVLQLLKLGFDAAKTESTVVLTEITGGLMGAYYAGKALIDVFTLHWGDAANDIKQIGYVASQTANMVANSSAKLAKEANKPWASTAALKWLNAVQAAANAAAKVKIKPGPPASTGGSAAAANIKRLGSIDKLIAGLKQEAATVGMTKDQTVLYKLSQLGATAADKAAATALELKIAALKRSQKVMHAVRATMKAMAEKIATFGMNATQKKIFDLKAMGATPADLAKIAAMGKQLSALEAHKKEMAQGAAVTKSFETSGQKQADKLAKLKKLLHDGAITWGTYKRAVESATNAIKAHARAAAGGLHAQEIVAGGAGFSRFESASIADKAMRSGSGSSIAKQTQILKQSLLAANHQSKNSDRQTQYLRRMSDRQQVVVSIGGGG
ncbi:MAG: hypothetical protein ACP5I8_12725 [Phycisphaerae bacterium]